jgi:hypothetical protein
MQYSEETQRQMFSMIECWQQSGLAQKTWCEQHSIRYHVFHYWYSRYKDTRLSVAAIKEPGFIPLQLQPAATTPGTTPPAAAGVHTELLLMDGRRLLFHQPVSADYLKALIS